MNENGYRFYCNSPVSSQGTQEKGAPVDGSNGDTLLEDRNDGKELDFGSAISGKSV